MTVLAIAPVPPRRRYTGTVLVDISAHVDRDGWLTDDGMTALWRGLAAAHGLRVRLEVGPLRFHPTRPFALQPAFGCASVEVSGTCPEGVAVLVGWLRHYAPEGDTQ